MRSKLFLFFLLGLIMISLASATNYEQSTNINFTTSCDLINCSDGDINLTIVDPVGNIIIDNQNTTKQTGYLYYSLNSTQTSELGSHKFFLSSDEDYYTSSFMITPNGEEATTSKAVFYIGLLFLLVVFLIVGIYGFVEADQIWTKTGSMAIIYIFLIAISFVSWNMSANFLTSAPFMIDFLRIIFLFLTIGFFPFLILLFVYGIWMMIQIEEIKKLQEQGFDPEEASDIVKKRKRSIMK